MCLEPSPGLGGTLLVDGPDALAGDRQLGDVHCACVSASVAKLQDPIPLTLHPTHHCTAGVVLHLGRHPKRETNNVRTLCFMPRRSTGLYEIPEKSPDTT